MNLNSSAVTALVLGLAAVGDAHAAGATCRKVDDGAADRVCRWQVGKGEFVNVYYGPPSPPTPPAPAPPREGADYAPPRVVYAEPVYYDYGYIPPFVIGAGRAHAADGHRGSRLVSAGRPPSFHGGFQGALQNGGPRSQGPGWGR